MIQVAGRNDIQMRQKEQRWRSGIGARDFRDDGGAAFLGLQNICRDGALDEELSKHFSSGRLCPSGAGRIYMLMGLRKRESKTTL